jgi:hypothetical protein
MVIPILIIKNIYYLFGSLVLLTVIDNIIIVIDNIIKCFVRGKEKFQPFENFACSRLLQLQILAVILLEGFKYFFSKTQVISPSPNPILIWGFFALALREKTGMGVGMQNDLH